MRICKFLFIFFIFTFLTLPVFATDINMNLSSNSISSNIQSNMSEHETTTNTQNEISNTSSSTTYSNTTTTVGSVSSVPESNLGLTNVLNILLITVGVVLIFLAIAILIRLR